MREQYWDYYTHIKYELLYFCAYLNDSWRWLKTLDVFLAAVSGSSVAAWALWHAMPMLWAFLIASAQVIGAIRQYLPFNKRVQALSALLPRLEGVVNRVDRDWFAVDRGECTDEQLNSLIFSYRKECLDLEARYLYGVYLPEREDLRKSAEEQAGRYFECF